jgi:signal recognition particle subunit SRP72
LQTKLWLLFKTSAYTKALDVANLRPDEFHFERAYALYRLQRESEAADVLAGLDESHRAALLQAQIVSYIIDLSQHNLSPLAACSSA